MKKAGHIKYIVSACLAGERCRYDGGSNTIDEIALLVKNGSAIPVCPEVLGGLGIPRARCELIKTATGQLIIGEDGKDYTESFIHGASISLGIARKNKITHAILKSKSPSCGIGCIYDGTFSGTVIEGNGIAAEMFINSGIKVFTENNFKINHLLN